MANEIDLLDSSDLGGYAESVLSILIENTLGSAEIPAIRLEDLVKNMRLGGMGDDEIRKVLKDDLYNGGPLFGGFRKQFKASGEQVIERSSQLVTNDIYKSELPREQTYDWELDDRVTNHCEDCLDRAEWEPMTLEEWELVGIPGSGVTACNLYCYCNLKPSVKD